MNASKSNSQLKDEIRDLERQLEEATDTLEAIRTGQIDALVVNDHSGHNLYTLKSADHAYRIFIEKMTEGAITVNSTGTILYSNSKFGAMVAQTLSNVLGQSLNKFFPVRFHKDLSAVIDNARYGEVRKEFMLSSGDTEMPVQLSINALQNDESMSLNILITDLTLQKQNERKLLANNQELGLLNEALSKSNHDLQQFASVASHDLQEPLRKIQVFTKFIKDSHAHELSETSSQYIEKIISSAQRMKVLILDILNYSRLSASNSNFEPTNLRNLVDEVLEDFELKVQDTSAVIEVSSLPTVEVIKGQMRQVFHNLVSNSLKFVKRGQLPRIVIEERAINAKELGVSLENPEQFCRIVVRDNGIGFSEVYASSIFSLFEKLNPKSSFEGSGIGLAIAKKIIDKHHGVIIAKSKEGEGAEFNIVLPLYHTQN